MACGVGDNTDVEECLSQGADVNYDNGVSSDYYCTDESFVTVLINYV